MFVTKAIPNQWTYIVVLLATISLMLRHLTLLNFSKSPNCINGKFFTVVDLITTNTQAHTHIHTKSNYFMYNVELEDPEETQRVSCALTMNTTRLRLQ